MTTATALCHTLLPTLGDLWFSTSTLDRAQAAAYCAQCPLLAACRAAGIAQPEEHGVWGGLTRAERRRAARRGPVLVLRVAPPRPCGSEEAFRAHRTYGEPIDPGCQAAHEAHVEAGRQAALDRHHAAGGTASGWRLHRKRGEGCDPCNAAMRADQAARRAVARAARGGLRSVPAGGGPPVAVPGPLAGAGAAA